VEIDETLKAAHCVEPDSEMQVPDMALNPLSRTASYVAGSRKGSIDRSWGSRSSTRGRISALSCCIGPLVSISIPLALSPNIPGSSV
jgi:hypothetical protein